MPTGLSVQEWEITILFQCSRKKDFWVSNEFDKPKKPTHDPVRDNCRKLLRQALDTEKEKFSEQLINLMAARLEGLLVKFDKKLLYRLRRMLRLTRAQNGYKVQKQGTLALLKPQRCSQPGLEEFVYGRRHLAKRFLPFSKNLN